uniref:Uncharacterized protein n=1 Tax=Oryza brachyantha TaxID=4533 RepID=J3LCP0_ORYBR
MAGSVYGSPVANQTSDGVGTKRKNGEGNDAVSTMVVMMTKATCATMAPAGDERRWDSGRRCMSHFRLDLDRTSHRKAIGRCQGTYQWVIRGRRWEGAWTLPCRPWVTDGTHKS